MLFCDTRFITDIGENQSERKGGVIPIELLISRFPGRRAGKMIETLTKMTNF